MTAPNFVPYQMKGLTFGSDRKGSGSFRGEEESSAREEVIQQMNDRGRDAAT